MRSPFHCDDVFFALLPQEKALPLLNLCPVEQVGKGSRTRGALSTSERSIFFYGIFIELARERRRKRNMGEDFSLFMYKVKRYDTYKSIASILQVVFISCYIGVTYPRFLRRI